VKSKGKNSAYNGGIHCDFNKIFMDNTVGSLTQLQKSVIIGTLLGDGYLRVIPGRKNAILEINHSFKAKDYVDWKYFVLKNVTRSSPKIRKNNKGRIAYRFYTKQLPELTEMYRLFYKNNKKVIPDNLVLNSTILSVWYMDDGSKCGNSNFYLNTQQYSLSDQKKLIDKLESLGLKARLNKDKKYWRIRLLSESLPRFKQLVEDKIILSMRYKICD
jgi:hypothetical protein